MKSESKAEVPLRAMTGRLAAHVDVMRRLCADLAGLISGREDEFLALGASLMEFSSRSQSLVQNASALTELCSGGEIAASAERLSSEVSNLSAVYKSDEFSSGLNALGQVMKLLSDLGGQIQEFGRIIKSLTMLGISTRIESARLGDQGLGFSTLADDVETLANKIVQDSSAIAEKSKALEALLGSVNQRTTALVKEQEDCSVGIMTDIDKSLHALVEMMERSRQQAEHIAQGSGTVAANVAEVVSSLQFHDIVRQQVEHVEEALADMITQASAAVEAHSDAPAEDGEADGEPAGLDMAVDDGLKDVVGWIADVSELQISQLDNASQRFAAAVSGLREGLSGISGIASEIGAAVNSILSAGERHGGATVMEQVGKSTKAILSAMNVFAEKSAEVAGLIGSVAGTVNEMTGFVSNIEEVGAEIELIALNASIKAAHTGEEGKALGVLAQAIQRLSVEARDRTQAVSDVLREIAAASEELEQASDTTERQKMIDLYAQSQTELMGALDGLSGRMSQAARDVLALSSTLGGDTDRLVRSIRLDAEICPGLDKSRDALRTVADEAREMVPVSDDAGRPARLKDLLSRYTMEAERLVHESAFGGGHGPVLNHEDEGEVELFDVDLFDEPGEEGASGEGSGEDWDNVELF